MVNADTDVSIDELIDHLCARAAKASPLLLDFARAYLHRLPADYLDELNPDQLCGQVQDVFEFASQRAADEVKIRAFNPDEAGHGYRIPVGVVEVISPDMSFLVDSLINELQAQGHDVERVFHPVIGTVRDDRGRLESIVPARGAETLESVQHFELARPITDAEAEKIEERVALVLRDVRQAVSDFEPMQQAVGKMIEIARAGVARYPADEVDEAVAFLDWLLDLNFVFLGYREYSITDGGEDRMISVVPGSGLGILSDETTSRFSTPTPISDLPVDLRARYEQGFLLVVTKTNNPSRVHRQAKMDYIGIRHIGPDGSVVGEARLLGLFTSKAYMTPADTLPVLRHKLAQILDAEDTMAGSHYYKLLVQLFNTFPKDELFATPTEEIRRSLVGLIEMQEREQVRLFIRPDLLQRNVSVLVVIPRDRFNAELRKALQAMLKDRFAASAVDYRLALDETPTARIHFTVWIAEGAIPDVDVQQLESDVVATTRTWEERVADRMVQRFGAERGLGLARRWAHCLPSYYRTSTDFDVAIGDICRLDELEQSDAPVVVGLQNEEGNGEALTRLTIYHAPGRLELSDVMPLLEDFGLRVVEEVPTRLTDGNGSVFIHDFGVLDAKGAPLELGACGDRVAATVKALLRGQAESDSLSRLIITAGLDYRQVAILRAYRTYWRRVGTGFTESYINDAFAAHPKIAQGLVRLFEARFGLDRTGWQVEGELVDRIADDLDRVSSLDEDRILRGFLSLVLATVRTNAFVPGLGRLAFKFDSSLVPNMPEPAPFFEIFVYAPNVEGVHLRGGRVARGGIRWSTRREDYRTEVLGLMKAQMTKNAVIVPTGSKGGYVLRGPGAGNPTREQVQGGYETFIRGLLDVTDNLVEHRVVHPDRIRVHDAGDPYLVVAADRGTTTFSDVANIIAGEYGFWLGDAFASGGSAGYDHKALGITARGAWESVKWHLRELAMDPAGTFTVVGIGDMSGDVFGNGMLLSSQIKLIAAFDHRHIFIDPDPDPAASFEERRRLFNEVGSTWADYERAEISSGGGVWSRSAKRIDLAPAAQRALGAKASSFTPNELIQVILRAPVDLLWNGGIGTYVKADDESNATVGDRANDAVRINASELRCRVVGEGGNLGFTQAARIEFARRGGRINTDFIDNSGGVNCSDREVNLKILLRLAEERDELTRNERDGLVQQVGDEIVERILYDSFLQAQVLAQEVAGSAGRIEAYDEFMSQLEAEGLLSRELEQLPGGEQLAERGRNGLGLTGPELSVLLAYAKRSLRDRLVASALPDSTDFDDEIHSYFPPAVSERFRHLIDFHPLRRELIATLVANEVVNSEGITFVSRLMAESGATAEEVVRAYRVARRVTGAEDRWTSVEALVGHIPPQTERRLLNGIDGLVEAVARWHLSHPSDLSMAELIRSKRGDFVELASTLAEVGPALWQEEHRELVDELVADGVPEPIAIDHALLDDLAFAMDVIDLAHATGHSVSDVARIALLVGPAFEVDWIEQQIAHLPTGTRWQREAIQSVRDDLRVVRRELTQRIIDECGDKDPDSAVDAYLVPRASALGRLAKLVRAIAAEGMDDVATAVVAIRHVRSLLR